MDAHDGDSPVHRILTLDGGGIRGVISLAILERLEAIWRAKLGRDDLVLADVYDFIAGTSTGAIIASCLAWGKPVADVFSLYAESGVLMFNPAKPWQRFRSRYRSDALAMKFKEMFVEADGTPATLGTDRLRTMLMVVIRNATTGSAWPLTSNPGAMYNDRTLPDCNLRIPLWQLVRASTAAPTFFPPERITLGGVGFTFMDGGITPYNNPSLMALLMATLPEYRIGWPTGVDRLHLVSVGTGAARARISNKPIDRLNLVDYMRYIPPALIGSIGEQQDTLCRVLGRCLYGEPIDREIGDLTGQGPISDDGKLCTYIRLNPPLRGGIRLDDVTRLDEMAEVGRRFAAEKLGEHVVR